MSKNKLTRKPTMKMFAQTNLYPAWVQPVTTLMLNKAIKDNPSEDDLILEARGLLAGLYNWRGRQLDVVECFQRDGSKINSKSLNEYWDNYNLLVDLSRQEAYRKSHPI